MFGLIYKRPENLLLLAISWKKVTFAYTNIALVKSNRLAFMLLVHSHVYHFLSHRNFKGNAHQMIFGDSLPHLNTPITRLQCVCGLRWNIHTISVFENHFKLCSLFFLSSVLHLAILFQCHFTTNINWLWLFRYFPWIGYS